MRASAPHAPVQVSHGKLEIPAKLSRGHGEIVMAWACRTAGRLHGKCQRGGGISLHTLDDHFLIEQVPPCKALGGELKIRYVAAVDIFTDAQGGLASASWACEAGLAIKLGLLDHSKAQLACNSEVQARLPADDSAVRLSSAHIARILQS